MGQENNNSAKFAFFYILSLIALVFVSISVGMIIFQIINKEILDVLNDYSSRYSDDQIRFGISALVISTPIFYITARQIYKNLFSGGLDKNSGIRKWLTYLILLVAIIVMIGWLVSLLNGFLGGELTTKFILKAMTALIISGAVFSFYFYDIKRDEIQGKKDKVIRIYFYASLVIIVAVFVASLLMMDSPQKTRDKKIDAQVVSNFMQIASGVNQYYVNNDRLPNDLNELQNEYSYIIDNDLKNPVTNETYTYRIVAEKEFELCTEFQSANQNDPMDEYSYEKSWLHDVGYQCLKQKVNTVGLTPIDKPIY